MFKKLFIGLVLSFMFMACQTSCAGRLLNRQEDAELQVLKKTIDSTVRIDIGILGVHKTGDFVDVYKHSMQGTGVVLNVGVKETMLLTASHICDIPNSFEAPTPRGRLVFLTIKVEFVVSLADGDRRMEAIPIRQDATNDLCLMKIEGKIGNSVTLEKKSPPRLSRVIIVGGPVGLYGKGLAYVGDGRFIGNRNIDNLERGFVSSAAAGGASGSGVFYRGRLVGLVVAVSPRFDHGTVVIPIEVIRQFLEKN